MAGHPGPLSGGASAALACVYAQGVVVRWFDVEVTREGVQAAFGGKGYLRVALEAGAQSGWVSRLLESLGYLVVVANPRKLKAISANKRKSDRNDALMLAKLVWADPSLLHPIQHRSEVRDLALTVLTARDAAVSTRTRLINTIRSMVKAAGIRLKRGAAQSFALRAAVVPPTLAPAIDGMFSVLTTANSIFLDGVHCKEANGDVKFRPVVPHTEDVDRLVVSIAESCEKWLMKQGYGAEDEAQEEDDALAVIQAAALAGKAALGTRAGKRVRRNQVLGGLEMELPPRCASFEGYNLHAGVGIQATNRTGLEQ